MSRRTPTGTYGTHSIQSSGMKNFTHFSYGTLARPIAVVLIITKIIGAVRKSRKDKPRVPEERRQQIRKTITYFLLTFIFLALGCVGLTRDYMELFFGNGFSISLLSQIVPHVILSLLGIFIVSQGYNIQFPSKDSENQRS